MEMFNGRYGKRNLGVLPENLLEDKAICLFGKTIKKILFEPGG